MKKLCIKGFADGIQLVFSQKLSVKEAGEELMKLSGEVRSFFTDDNVRVSYSGTEFSYDEEILFAKAVKKVFGKNAEFVKKQKLTSEKIRYSLAEDEAICKVVEKSLRSGEEVVSDGNVLIIGDVNPGATVSASGNITVIGALRGNAYVKKGGKVYATYMCPSQIRIGKVYSYNKKMKNVGAAIAVAENGEIILQCL